MVQENLGNSWEKLSFKKTREIIICLFVDDSEMMGKEKVLVEAEKDLKTNFTVTEVEMLNYVGCDYIVTSNGITPATAGYTERGIKEGDERVADKGQSQYTSGVGFY